MIRRLLLALTARLPVRVIAHEGRPFLERYWVAQGCGLQVYLHRFIDDDPDGLHDHPWRFSVCLMLAGGYMEDRRHGMRLVRWINVIAGDTFHRVRVLHDARGRKRDCWTLFIHSARVKPWGFLRYRGVPHLNYFADEGQAPVTVYETARESGGPFSEWGRDPDCPRGRDIRGAPR